MPSTGGVYLAFYFMNSIEFLIVESWNNMENGGLIVITGPSGVGKGTIVKQLIKKNENLKLSISVTTREKRKTEQDGVHYYFKTYSEFKKFIDEGKILEYTVYNNNYYGTLEMSVKKWISEGYNVVLEIEVDGAMQIKNKIQEALLIFLLPPSMCELERRLRERATEDEENIKRRLLIARRELMVAIKFDHLIVNENTIDTTNKIDNIIKRIKEI